MNNGRIELPSHRFLSLILGILIIACLYASSLYSYLLFHTLIELSSIVVSFAIFILAWNTRRVLDNHYLLFLGVSVLFTGALELLHTLAYKGFGVFPDHDANLPTQLWVAFRYLYGVSCLCAPLFINRQLNMRIMVGGYAVATTLLIGAIFLSAFPDCYVEGRGLTPFKMYSEYAIIFLLLAGFGLLVSNRHSFDRWVFRLMSCSILLSVLSELLFTQYISVFGSANVLGHFFLLASTFCLYKAIVVTGLIEPSQLLFRTLTQSEDALRRSEDRFRLALRTAPVSLAAQDMDLRYSWVYNQRMAGPEEIIGHFDHDIFTPDEAARLTAIKQRVIGEDTELREQMWLERPEGRIFLDISMEPIHDENGRIIGVRSATVDLTKIKLTEEALRLSEEKFSLAFANNPAALAITKLEDGRFVEVNDTWVSLIGYSREEAIGHSAREMQIWPTPEAAAGFVRELQENGIVSGWEQEFRKKSGEVFVAQMSTQVLDVQGDKMILTTLVDVTERKLAENKLRDRERLLRDVIDGSPSPISLKDVDGKFITINKSFEKMLGMSREDIKGKTDNDIAPREIADYRRTHDKKVMETGNPVQIEEVADLPDGRHVFLANKFPLVDADRQIYGVGAISHDITERKQADEMLKERTQQLEDANKELESFSYSVSHDLKAPLRAIEGFSRMLLKKDADQLSEDALRKLDVIRSNADRMNTLIDDLLSFSKVLKSNIAISEINVDELAKEAWTEIQSANTEREIELRIKNILPGKGDPALVRQVLLNLLSNAVKFTKSRKPGIIEMSCYSENGHVVYCVKDNGLGFDMAYHDKLFGVFQRLHSHEEYEGTGVGLAIVHRIINRHGGKVWAEGEVDKGATFYFTLPAL